MIETTLRIIGYIAAILRVILRIKSDLTENRGGDEEVEIEHSIEATVEERD